MQRVKILLIYGIMIMLLLQCSGGQRSESAQEPTSNDGGMAALTDYHKSLPLDKIKLPSGFKIEVFAEVENARSLAISPSGVVYVGNRNEDKVYAVKDTDGDFKA